MKNLLAVCCFGVGFFLISIWVHRLIYRNDVLIPKEANTSPRDTTEWIIIPDSCGTDTIFELDVSNYKYIRIVVVPPKETLSVTFYTPTKPQSSTSKPESSFDWDSFAKRIAEEMDRQ